MKTFMILIAVLLMAGCDATVKIPVAGIEVAFAKCESNGGLHYIWHDSETAYLVDHGTFGFIAVCYNTAQFPIDMNGPNVKATKMEVPNSDQNN